MTSSKRRALDLGLFIFGCIGVAATAVMSGRDTLKAETVLKDERIYRTKAVDNPETAELEESPEVPFPGVKFENKPLKQYIPEAIKAAWKCYIPTAVTMTLTLSTFIASKRLSAKEIAALSTAVAGAGSIVSRYRQAILDRTNEDILHEIDREVAAEEITKAKPPVITTSGLLSSEEMDLSKDGEFIFFDPFTKIKFKSTKLAVLGAKYFLNRNFALGGNVPLSMFYEFLGIALPEEFNYCQWDIGEMEDSGFYWIDLDIVRSKEPDPETGEMYYILEYGVDPGECEDSFYPFGNPINIEGSVAG